MAHLNFDSSASDSGMSSNEGSTGSESDFHMEKQTFPSTSTKIGPGARSQKTNSFTVAFIQLFPFSSLRRGMRSDFNNTMQFYYRLQRGAHLAREGFGKIPDTNETQTPSLNRRPENGRPNAGLPLRERRHLCALPLALKGKSFFVENMKSISGPKSTKDIEKLSDPAQDETDMLDSLYCCAVCGEDN